MLTRSRPVQEQASKRLNGARGKQEGSFGNESTTRPSLLETRHISRTSGNGTIAMTLLYIRDARR